MAYRTIADSFWSDPKVDDDFTPEDKYFYLYLLTNPHTNICGCYEISFKNMENETGYSKETLLKLLERLETVHEVIKFDKKTKEVLILNWSKYNWSTSTNLIKSVRSVAAYIKSGEFRGFVVNKTFQNDKNTKYITETEIEIDTEIETETDTDTDTDTDTESDSDSDSELDGGIGYRYPMDRVSEKVNYQEILDKYHSVCSSLPAVKKLTDKRKAKIKERLKDYSLEEIYQAFEKLEQSDFATGKVAGSGGRTWKADFDFVFANDTNISKILEGKYDNRAEKIAGGEYDRGQRAKYGAIEGEFENYQWETK